MPTHSHFQQTRQLYIWGFQHLTGKNKNVWFHPHFIRGSVDGLKRIKRVEVIRMSDTSQRGPPPERRPTFDSKELAHVAVARLVAMPDSEPVIVKALDQKQPEATVPSSDPMLVQTLQKYNQITQKIARIHDKIRLIDEKKEKAAQLVPPTPFPQGIILRTVEQCWQSAVPTPPSSRPPEHEIWDLEQQQKAKVAVFQHTLPTPVNPSPVIFVDNAPVQENPPYLSFPSSPSSPQSMVNSSHLRELMSSVGKGTIIPGGHVQPPANDKMDDHFQLLVSQIFEPFDESSCDCDSCCSVMLSDDLEGGLMDPNSF